MLKTYSGSFEPKCIFLHGAWSKLLLIIVYNGAYGVTKKVWTFLVLYFLCAFYVYCIRLLYLHKLLNFNAIVRADWGLYFDQELDIECKW